MYLINQQVEFDPAHKRMTNRQTGKDVHLQLPASLCLLYLIANRNEIASQNTLLKVGWGARNEVTTPNTFYQSILTLRNALADVGLSRETVKTISRRGLILDDKTTVEKIPRLKEQEKISQEKKPLPLRKIKSRWGLYGASLLWAAILSMGLVDYFLQPELPFQNFIPSSLHLRLEERCDIYHAANEIFSTRSLKMLDSHPELCVAGSHVFISGHRHAERVAAFVCNKDARKDATAVCASHYYWTEE